MYRIQKEIDVVCTMVSPFKHAVYLFAVTSDVTVRRINTNT